MSRRAELPLLLGLLLAAPAQAADETPDLALLEFLGEWEDGEGRWVDPLEFLEQEEGKEDKVDMSGARPGEENGDEQVHD